MNTVAVSNMFLRAYAELPTGFMLETEEFREGWNFAPTANAEQLRQRARRHGWSLVKVINEILRSGVGDTSQLAIASAVKLALRHVTNQCNAAEVGYIELTQYPWFYFARVRVYPYLIQQGLDLPSCDDAAPRQRQRALHAPDLNFGCTMPQLKQMLVLSKGSETRVQ
jgi:hypothetical protein